MIKGRRGYDSVLAHCAKTATISSRDQYEDMYDDCLRDPEGFWSRWARRLLVWERESDSVLDHDFEAGRVQWFEGGVISPCFNCLDRWLDSRAHKPALHWISSDLVETKTLSYKELFNEVTKFAALLRGNGVGKGDRVVLYLPVIPETVVAMLACSRIGAIHCNVFSGYSAQALARRINDCSAKALVTTEYDRGGAGVKELGVVARKAVQSSPSIEFTIFMETREAENASGRHREISWKDAKEDHGLSDGEPFEPMASEDPLFITPVSGPTLKPTCLVHGAGGYLLYAAMVMKFIYDAGENDNLWFSGDTSTISGHTLSVYGPLSLGLCSVLYEGAPNLAGPKGPAKIIETFRVSHFIALPSRIKRIMEEFPEGPEGFDLSSLKLLGLTEEIPGDDALDWMFSVLGEGKRPLINSYSLSEGGGPMISTFPAIDPLDYPHCGRPFFGIRPVVLNPDTGERAGHPDEEGALCFEAPWPGMAHSAFDDHERFLENYMLRAPGLFFSGDGAKRDEQGYYHALGRIDDVINVEGRRLSIPELEAAILDHDSVEDAAVVGYPHPIKGSGVYAFVELEEGTEIFDELKWALNGKVHERIGDFMDLDVIQWTDTLPRTPSGKLLRVLLQRIAAGNTEDLGAAAEIAETEILEDLIKGRKDIPL